MSAEGGSEGWGTEGWGTHGWGPEMSRIFSLARHNFLSSLSWGSSRGIWWPSQAKIPREDPQEREEILKLWRERGKKPKFWAVRRRAGGRVREVPAEEGPAVGKERFGRAPKSWTHTRHTPHNTHLRERQTLTTRDGSDTVFELKETTHC